MVRIYLSVTPNVMMTLKLPIILLIIFTTLINTIAALEYTATRLYQYNDLAGVYSGGTGNVRPGARYCPGSFVINGEFWLYGGLGSISNDSMYHLFFY